MSQLFPNAKPRNVAPYRNDVVGSFLRTESLMNAKAKLNAGEISQDEYDVILKDEIGKLVAKQKENGLHAVTDGEFSRVWWHLDFMAELDGVEWVETENFSVQFKDAKPKSYSVKIVDKIDFSDSHPFVKAYQILKDCAGDTPTKFTIPSPSMPHLVACVRDVNYEPIERYKDESVLYQDIADAYIKAMHKFYEMGLRNLQLDDTSWGQFCALDKKAEFAKRGIDFDKLAVDYVAMLNRIVDAKPADMQITMHICRGNFRSTWFSEGGYAPIAEVLFGTCRVDGFFLEYDSERAGDFAPLAHIKDQQVVLGLVTSKTGDLENKDDIIARIREATQYVDINQLCLSPQCGFASTEEGNILTEEAQWAKVKMIREIADEVWGE
ncbi:5-methyltetrahydropteroyltriglutamate--homocysteine methyltransferase [Moraxella lacunata]|uniref:5-methyltetrahydropteroyltriglutamate--homocysteine methyltransferase n=1 Tax=Moraxella lacunata TaxID=477 RepID=A0A378TTW5_MORLA|nr:5-methyltetrahydropteroyltriglutamate--homocysteine S-methyltransferase [Moraxella lacunata]STZ64177.1 5-methyltetrahydropteroyltriglutamate--homocysteine methyltransferase [Moraxella lacunata]